MSVRAHLQTGQTSKEGSMRRVVPICCFCEKVRDDTGTEPGGGAWLDFKFYMTTYMVRPEETMFSHTYCPGCLSMYRTFLASPERAVNRNDAGKGA